MMMHSVHAAMFFLQVKNKISILLPWDTGEHFSGADFILGPIYFVFLLLIAFFTRNIFVKDPDLKPYFIPGLLVKLLGSIAVGLIYAFYYKGGDTSIYYYDSSVLYQTFIESPAIFFKIIFSSGKSYSPEVYEYAVQMHFLTDSQAFMVSKIAGLIALLSFRTYSVSSLFFAFFSYAGVWALLVTFCKIYPQLKRQFAIAVLFIPSVFFWGSGILKDTITFSCVGWMTYCIYNIFFLKRKIATSVLILAFSIWLCASIKGYIVLSILPPFMLWIFLNFTYKVQSQFFRKISTPLMVIMGVVLAYVMVLALGNSIQKYSIDNFAETAKSYTISNAAAASGGAEQGSVYDVGQNTFNGSIGSFASAFPKCVVVTLFRPFLWEVHNPVMLMAGLESFIFLAFTLRILFRVGLRRFLRSIGSNPFVFFCMAYSLLFAFAVGFSAGNFGALVRYKIPCMPFYLAALYVMNYETKLEDQKKREKREKEKTRKIRLGGAFKQEMA